jgi:hypothetical protein
VFSGVSLRLPVFVFGTYETLFCFTVLLLLYCVQPAYVAVILERLSAMGLAVACEAVGEFEMEGG